MYEPPDSKITDSQGQAADDASDAFCRAAAKPSTDFQSLKARISELRQELNKAAGSLSLEEINSLLEEGEEICTDTKTMRMDHLWDKFDTVIGAINDPDAPDMGERFLEAKEKAACKTVIDKDIKSCAAYVSYVFGADPSYQNRIKVNPKRIARDEMPFVLSATHEYGHAFEKGSAPALHRSPSNSDSRAVIHPADWMRLEVFCERHAFTLEAVIKTILAKDNPDIRANSEWDVVKVREFEAIREKFPKLEDAVVYCARTALNKFYIRNNPERNFVDYYHDVALNNYRIGMNARTANNDRDLTFLRLDDADLWKVGNCGIIPNVFGEYFPEPLSFKRDPLRPTEQAKLDKLCQDFKIPPLEHCPTLAQYEESISHAPPPAMAYSEFRGKPMALHF